MFMGGHYISKINSYGIDYLDEMNMAHLSDLPEKEVISSIVLETKVYVDKKIEEISPEIKEKLELSYISLNDNPHSHNNVRIAFDCREILKDFTDAIINENYLEEGEKFPERKQTKIKLKITLKSLCKSETTSKLLSERYNYLINYFDVLSDYIQKNTHPENFEVTIEDAKSCLIYTYLFMRDIFKILDNFN